MLISTHCIYDVESKDIAMVDANEYFMYITNSTDQSLLIVSEVEITFLGELVVL